MLFTPDNFLQFIKELITGKNGPFYTNGSLKGANSADGGIKHDVEIPLVSLQTLGGSISTGITPNAAITDSTGGTGSATFASIIAGTSYAQADLVALKNIASETATSLNAIRTALTALETIVVPGSATTDSGKIPVISVPAGSNEVAGTFSFTIPRDYDEASDHFEVRVLIALGTTASSITLTGTPTILPIATGTPTTGSAVTGTAPFQSAALNLTTTEQVVVIDFGGNGLKRDDVIAVKLIVAGTTSTNPTLIYDVEVTYDSTIVSYNVTDATGEDGSLQEEGNPLR